MSLSVPDGWTIRSIGEIAAITMGQSPPSSVVNSDGMGLPFIQGNAEFGARYPKPRQFAAECPKVVDAGDILLSVRAPVGEVNVAPDRLCIGRGLAGLRPIEGDHDFLYFALGGLAPVFARLSQGSTFDAINGKDLRSIRLLVPPLDEQRRIAEVLRSVDETIGTSQEALGQSRVVQSSLITDLCFGHGYPMVSLGQILDDIRYGTSAKCAAGEENGQPVLRIPNVVNGRVEADDLKYAVVSDADRQRYSLHPGDIVVVRTNGNPAYIGRSALIAVDAEAYLFASYLIRMRFDGNVAWPPYVYAALNSQPVRELLLKAATTSAGNYNINTASLKRITIPLPDLTTQHQISEAIRGATDAVNADEYEVESLLRTKAMLMSDLLSGRVRVPVGSVPASSNVPPAFKRAVFAAEIVHQLHDDNRFGSVKHEKIVHLCELHLDLHADLDRHAYKEAAGPYDPTARRSVEGIFAKQKWFKAHKPDGKRVVYSPLEKSGAHKVCFDRYFGSRQSAIQAIVDLMRPLDTQQCEIVATLYAVWNDFLIDGTEPTDDAIVASVLEWHPKKATITKDRWLRALPWMRNHGLIPTGKGEKTRVTVT
ncbi:MAG: restriction endonuclease subunit S [Sphingomonadaceae bacterium]